MVVSRTLSEGLIHLFMMANDEKSEKKLFHRPMQLLTFNCLPSVRTLSSITMYERHGVVKPYSVVNWSETQTRNETCSQ